MVENQFKENYFWGAGVKQIRNSLSQFVIKSQHNETQLSQLSEDLKSDNEY